MTAKRAFSLLVIALFIYVASPLLVPLAMGAVFAVLFFPVLERMENRKLSTVLASTLLTVGITLLILLPAALLTFLGVKAGLKQLRVWKDVPQAASPVLESASGHPGWMDIPAVQGILERVTHWFPVSASEVSTTIEDMLRNVGARAAELLGSLFGQIPTATMGLVITIISIYFFLVDSRKILLFVRRHSFFTQRQTEELIHAFAGMCRSVILATVISGVAQSLLYTLVALICGVKSAFLIGFVVFITSFIPLLGSSPVTFGVAVHQLLIGNKTVGIVLLITAVVAGLVDNVIRPIVLKGAGNLHPLLAFVAAFGGLQVLGFVGVFLGPILAGMFVVTVAQLLETPETENG